MSTPSAELTHNVVSTRVFDAPVERVWHAWSDGEQVMRWWMAASLTDNQS